MTSLNPKLTAALTTIAILAPAASAQANRPGTERAAGHVAIIQPERHYSRHGANRHYCRHRADDPALKFQRDIHGAW